MQLNNCSREKQRKIHALGSEKDFYHYPPVTNFVQSERNCIFYETGNIKKKRIKRAIGNRITRVETN